MTTDPDIQREWLLSKWERFTDDELNLIGCWKGYVDGESGGHPSAIEDALQVEIDAEIARRQADAEADTDGC